MEDPFSQWWQRPDLTIAGDRLTFAGRCVDDLVAQFGTPAFFYNAPRIAHKIESLHHALDAAGLHHRYRIYYAMKANRFAPLLTFLKQTGRCGIDACSPAEVEHAVSCGFSPDEVSFTATSLSDKDFRLLAGYRGLSINCDSIHAIRKIGERCPGRRIGIRVNPAMGVGYGQIEKLRYSGTATTKFGVYQAQFQEALDTAARCGLTVAKIHFHTGCGYLNGQLDLWDDIIGQCLWFVDQAGSVDTVNVGGGLGVPHTAEDQPLDLARWAGILARRFRDRPLTVEIEPGDFIVKDSGILALTVNTVEKKQETVFVGVDAGFNIAVEPAVYGLPFQPVPARIREGRLCPVTLVGNINEALDVWYHQVCLPPLIEGDAMVLINAGAYSSSMSSNHCMRGSFKEFLLF